MDPVDAMRFVDFPVLLAMYMLCNFSGLRIEVTLILALKKHVFKNLNLQSNYPLSESEMSIKFIYYLNHRRAKVLFTEHCKPQCSNSKLNFVG
jgi:hypothetical protein